MECKLRILKFNPISTVIDYIFEYFLKKPREAEIGKVYLPKFFAIIGVITSAPFLIFAGAAYLGGEIIPSLILLALSMLGGILIVAFVNCRIYYDDDGFVAKNFFGIKRKVAYDQVTAMKKNMHETYIYIGKRRVMVDEFSVGGKEFINLVRKKYRTFHNGQSIPKMSKSKHDIFKGNVNDVAGFLAAYIIIFVILIGVITWLTCYALIPSSVNNTLEQTVIFSACDIEEDEVVLTSADNQIYRITFDAEQLNIQAIKAICNGKLEVTAYSKEVTPDARDDYYSVKAIRHNDDYILSFEETNRLHRQNGLSVVALFSFMLIIWVAFIAASVIIGRNPKKFSKKVVRLFFKDGYINY